MSFFSGVQQIGIGVSDAPGAFAWYKQQLGFSMKFFDDEAEAKLMYKYTGDSVHKRRAILALKPQGGGGLEIWQYLSRKSKQQPKIRPGSLGILAAIVGSLPTQDIEKGVLWDQSLGLKDFDGNSFIAANSLEGGKAGIRGAAIGVSDLQASEQFYCDVLGFSKISEHDISWQGINGTEVVLQLRGKPALFHGLLGHMELRLIHFSGVAHEHLFTNRYWGDLGFIHLCFEVPEMDSYKEFVESKGQAFYVDSQNSFGMSNASGRFAYMEDPDGTLIELVETHKIPVIKALGVSLDLKKYKKKPIESWKLSLMKLFN